MSSELLLVGDLHLGLKQSDEKWLKIVFDVCKWVRTVADERNINTIVVMGDFFHDRTDINLLCLDYASKIMELWKGLKVVILTGNHDCYFRDNSNVHSLEMFKHIQGVLVVDKPVYLKNICFCEWGCDIDKLEDKKYLFGHFEIDTFKMGHKVCDGKIPSTKLLAKFKHIYTGHFHQRQIRKYSGNKNITYLGTPYEMDWGDCNDKKYIHILDVKNNNLEEIENTFSPRHIVKTDLTDDNVSGNIIKYKLKEELTEDQKAIINLLGAFKWDAEYETVSEVSSVAAIADDKISSLDMKVLFEEYVNCLDIQNEKIKNKVILKLEKHYANF